LSADSNGFGLFDGRVRYSSPSKQGKEGKQKKKKSKKTSKFTSSTPAAAQVSMTSPPTPVVTQAPSTSSLGQQPIYNFVVSASQMHLKCESSDF
jgi:hypothetical protein